MWSSEEQLAAAVAAWLGAQGWDVYPEVCLHSGSERADIVAVRGSMLWVIECKRTFGLAVIAQADAWLPYSNITSVAVPIARRSSSRSFGERVCGELGIGIIRPQHGLPQEWHSKWGGKPPKFRRHCDPSLRAVLSESHKKYAPGNASCKYHTPFRETCDRVRDFVHSHGPATIGEVMRAIEHHYTTDKSAIASMRDWARAGKVPGVGVDDTVTPFRFVPVRVGYPVRRDDGLPEHVG